MTRKATRRLTVWIALAALLFSALSPAMASVLFADRPQILARVLALPAAAPAYMPGEICHTAPVGTTAANPDADAGTDHAAHGIYCSFCLASGSLITMPSVAAPTVAFALTAPEPLPAVRVQRPYSSVPTTHHSRGPPVVTHAR